MGEMRRGITLLELLVVLIIVSILATVAVTIYSGSERNAQAAKARHALSLIAEAEKIYYSDNGAYLTLEVDNFSALSAATGIDLESVERDADWDYWLPGGTVLKAKKVGNPCNDGTIDLDLKSGTFTPAGGIGGCF